MDPSASQLRTSVRGPPCAVLVVCLLKPYGLWTRCTQQTQCGQWRSFGVCEHTNSRYCIHKEFLLCRTHAHLLRRRCATLRCVRPGHGQATSVERLQRYTRDSYCRTHAHLLRRRCNCVTPGHGQATVTPRGWSTATAMLAASWAIMQSCTPRRIHGYANHAMQAFKNSAMQASTLAQTRIDVLGPLSICGESRS